MRRHAPIRPAAALLVLLALFSPMVMAAQPPVRVAVVRQGDAPVAFGRLEFAVDPGRTFRNPFDPNEVAVDATFTGPSGRAYRIPGFWFVPPTGEEPGFRLRFAPTEAGRWSVAVAVADGQGSRVAESVLFDVAAGASRGFVRRAANNRYFTFDDGTTYFPVGLNLAWPQGEPSADWYDRWLGKLAANGGNFARVWMCHRPVHVEPARLGLNRYDPVALAYFDDVLAHADRHGVRVMLCFLNHRDFLEKDMWGEADWPVFPYSAKHGGPATRPADFFTDPACREFFRRRLRYLVARYGAFTSLGFWELINEQEYAGTPVPDDWNAEMAAYLKATDPYRRLVTTSAKCPPAVWADENIDLTQVHLYGDGSQTDVVGPIRAAVAAHDAFAKPHLVGEIGASYKGPDTQTDPNGLGTTLHNSLWTGALSGSAGTAMYWWWDNYVEPKDQWHKFKPIARFTAAIDFAGKDFRPVRLPPVTRRLAPGEPEIFTDLVLTAAAPWGRSHGQPIQVEPSGDVDRELPRFHYGTSRYNADKRAPFSLAVDLPADGELVLRVGEVSDAAMLRVLVDNEPTADFAFSALPGSAGLVSTRRLPEHDNLYQGRVDAERRVPLRAGKRVITIDNLAGDWCTIESVTFTNARPARFPAIHALALQDAASGETLAWVYDPQSHWVNDRDGVIPAEHRGAVVTVRPAAGVTGRTYRAEVWDTRTGSIVRTSEALQASGGVIEVPLPAFRRDVAVRLMPEER